MSFFGDLWDDIKGAADTVGHLVGKVAGYVVPALGVAADVITGGAALPITSGIDALVGGLEGGTVGKIDELLGAAGGAASLGLGVAHLIGGAASAASTAGEVSAAPANQLITSTSALLTGTSAAGSATSALSAGSGIASTVASFLGKGTAASTVVSIFTAISNFIKEFENVDKTYIIPITQGIGKSITEVESLTNQVKTLAHSGIQGILAIPAAVGDAVAGIDATLSRFGTVLGAQNKQTVNDDLIPGLSKVVGDPIASIGNILSFHEPGVVTGVGAEPKIQLDEAVGLQALWDKFNADLSAAGPAQGFFKPIISAFIDVAKVIFTEAGILDTFLSWARQSGLVVNPIEPLDLGSTLKAFFRGIITAPQAQTEAARHGIGPERWATLQAIEAWLPDIERALRLYYRGVIDQATFEAALEHQALTPADIKAVDEAFAEPVNPREAIAANGRFAALNKGFLPDSYGSKVPGQYADLYRPRFVADTVSAFDWIEHWRTPPVEWWITAYYRGLVTAEQVTLAAEAENIPSEVIDKLVQVNQEVVQLWMVPDMLATGILSNEDADSYLAYIGLAARDRAIIIKYGEAKAAAPKSAQAAELAAISAGAAKSMFEDGIIDAATYTEILLDHNFSQEAAVLTVDLAKQEVDLTNRKNQALLVVDQVEAGVIDTTTAQAQLYQLGYTTGEVANYIAQAEDALVKKRKVPTDADLKDFLKAGIITEAQAVAGLQVNGWSATYAQAFITLWIGAPTSVVTPATG